MEANTSKRRELLSGAQRAQLLALPTVLREFEERYSFTPSDLEFIGAHRTNSNRLGIAVQLCFLRHPGWAWTPEERIPATMLHFSAKRLSYKVLPVEMPVHMWPIGIVTLKGRTPNPALRLLIECAQEVAKPLASRQAASAYRAPI